MKGNLFYLILRETDIDYLEPVIHIWEMKWSALKNLVECGYRRYLVFLQGLITVTFFIEFDVYEAVMVYFELPFTLWK